MWNENRMHEHFADHGRVGFTPSRQEIARQAYVEKIRARREAEQSAATTGAVTNAISQLWSLTRAMVTRTRSTEIPTKRTAAEFPAE